MQLDQAFLTLVSPGIYSVWNVIGNDVYECAGECGEEVSNEEALESCLDAGRLSMYGHADTDAAISAAIKANTYSKVMKFLKKNIQLA